MAKNRFKPRSKSIGFKSIGAALQAGERRLTEQTDRQINALKLQKEQQREIDNLTIDSVARNNKFEQGVLSEKHQLEELARKHHRGAWEKYWQTDIDRLKQEAKYLGEEADFLRELAPKRAKMAENLFTAFGKGIQTLQANNAWDEYNNTDQSEYKVDETSKANFSIVSDALKDGDGIVDNREWRTLEKSVNGSSNIYLGARHWDDFNELRNTKKDEVKTLLKEKYNTVLTENTADEWYRFAGYEELRRRGINPTSKYGRKILGQYIAWGRAEKSRIANSNDANDTLTTNNRIADVVQALRTDASITIDGVEYSDLNLQFNTGVKAATRGTYKEGDGFTVTLPGYGEGYSKFLDHFLEKHGHRFQTEAELREFLSKLKVIGDKKGNVGNEYWAVKHKTRTDESIEKWSLGLDAKKREEKKKRNTKGNATYLSTIAEIDKIKEENNGSMPPDKRLEIIERTNKSDIDDGNKNDIYGELKFDPKGYNRVSYFLAAHQAVADSDEKKLMQVLSFMEPSGRKKFESEVKLLRDLNEAQPVIERNNTQYKGSVALGMESRSKIQEISKGVNRFGNANLHSSGETASTYHKQLVLNEFHATEGKGPVDVRLRDAKATVHKEWVQNAVEVKPDGQGGWVNKHDRDAGKFRSDNPFNYTTQRGGVPGLWSPGVVFVKFNDHDANLATSLEEYTTAQDLADLDVTDRDKNLEGIQLIELHDDTIKYGDKDEVLDHVRLVSPDKETIFISALKKEVKDPSVHQDIAEILPERLKYYADVHDLSYSEVANKWLKNKKYNVRISADGTDAGILKRGKDNKLQVFKPKGLNSFNSLASSAYEASKAQGVYPMDSEVRFSIEEGLDADLAWAKQHDIQWDTDETGKYVFSDPGAFLTNGGIGHLDQAMAMSMGLLWWDDTVGWYGSEEEKNTQRRLYNVYLKNKKERLKR